MTISLDALLALAGDAPARMKRLGELARRLNRLDAQRAAILAELAELGVTPDPMQPAAGTDLILIEASEKKLERPRLGPRCVKCDAVAEMTVDGVWYCERHDPTA